MKAHGAVGRSPPQVAGTIPLSSIQTASMASQTGAAASKCPSAPFEANTTTWFKTVRKDVMDGLTFALIPILVPSPWAITTSMSDALRPA